MDILLTRGMKSPGLRLRLRLRLSEELTVLI
jgi:hypothetical protein